MAQVVEFGQVGPSETVHVIVSVDNRPWKALCGEGWIANTPQVETAPAPGADGPTCRNCAARFHNRQMVPAWRSS